MSDAMEITVNGERKSVPRGITVERLLANLGLGQVRVAVERNRAIVPRAQHGSEEIAAGDVLEIVTFVGGG